MERSLKSRSNGVRPLYGGGVLLFLALGTAVGGQPRASSAQGTASPSLIAFAADTSEGGRSSKIFVSSGAGTAPRQVTSGDSRDRAPALSPDGKWLAYQANDALGLDVLMVQPVEGGKPLSLGVGMYPQWSRDGRRLLFSRRQVNEYGLYIIRADGSQKEADLKPLTRGQIGRWSPDERQIAAVVPVILEGKDRWQIQVMPVDTLRPTFRATLPESYGQVVSLDWAPAGDELLFSVSREARYDLYAMSLKAPEPRRLPSGDGFPNAAYGAWSPDGKEILFRATSEAAPGGASGARLCVMKADGGAVRVLWQPDKPAIGIYGAAWRRPATALVVAPPVTLPVVPPVTPPVTPMPVTPPVTPAKPVTPAPGPRVLGPAKKLYGTKLFQVAQERSPVTVNLSAPGAADFVVSASLLPVKSWTPRRQGIGFTVQLEDGALYRATAIHSGGLWGTVQGRRRGGKVQLIDGKKVMGNSSFATGFQLTMRREGKNLIVAIDGQEVAARPVLFSAVKSLSLTLENFDPGAAPINLGGVHYREWVAARSE